jgi:hypothetical protein
MAKEVKHNEQYKQKKGLLFLITLVVVSVLTIVVSSQQTNTYLPSADSQKAEAKTTTNSTPARDVAIPSAAIVNSVSSSKVVKDAFVGVDVDVGAAVDNSSAVSNKTLLVPSEESVEIRTKVEEVTTKSTPVLVAKNMSSNDDKNNNSSNAKSDQQQDGEVTTGIYISKFCNASTGEFVVTNFSADVIVADVSKLMVFDQNPVLVRSNASQKPYATCTLGAYVFYDHFPHFMQQLYRCWSFWQQNSDKQPVFILAPKLLKPKKWNQAMRKEFTRGMLRLLPQVGIKVIDSPADVEAEKNNDNITAALTMNDTESISASVGRAILGTEETHFQTVSTKDMNTLRNQILSVLLDTKNSSTSIAPPPPPSGCHARGNSSNLYPRIAIIDRKSNRRILNLAEVVEDLQSHFHFNHQVPVIYFEGTSFEDQVKTLSGIDILITGHGAQETGLPFMPDCGSVLEIFPDHYYYPRFFGTLAASAGLQHSFLNLAANTSEHSFWVMAGKALDICPHTNSIRRALEEMLARWHKCCDGMTQ